MEIYNDLAIDHVRPPWTYESCAVHVASFRQGCP